MLDLFLVRKTLNENLSDEKIGQHRRYDETWTMDGPDKAR